MTDASDSRTPGPAVRLICTADDDGVRVVSRRRLAKVVPPSEPLDDELVTTTGRAGFWVEVRDADERVRYRRVLPDPLSGEVEVPGGQGSFTRQTSAQASATFALLVPDVPGADHVSLLRGGPPARGPQALGTAGRTGEIARLALDDEEPAP